MAPSADAQETITLSTGGTGAVRARWDPSGNLQCAVLDASGVPDPPSGYFVVGYDAANTQLLTFRHNDGTTVRTSAFRTDAQISALCPLTEATTSAGSSLVADPPTRSLKRLDVAAPLTLDTSTDPARLIVGSSLVSLDGLSDAVSASDRLTLGVGTAATPAAGDTVVGAGAAAAASGGSNTAVGHSALASGTGASNVAVGAQAMNVGVTGTAANNVAVGADSARGLRNGSQNVAVGAQAGAGTTAVPSDANNNTSVGYQCGYSLTTGGSNTAVGAQALKACTTGANNVCVGNQSGSALTTGSGNTILGGHTGSAALTNALVLSDGTGTVRARWDNANNGVFSVDGTATALTADNTMTFQYTSSQQGLNVYLRMGGTVYTLELNNERPITTTNITGNTTLTAAHRNRFTQVVSGSAVTITVVAYTGIVVGSEHEFFNAGAAKVSMAAGSGVTIRSVSSLLSITSYGAVVSGTLAQRLLASRMRSNTWDPPRLPSLGLWSDVFFVVVVG